MTILLTMLFWTDGYENSTRIRNALFSYNEMKNLYQYLQKNNIDCNIKIYDFSPSQIIPDSIHRPYPLGEYKKAKKINTILKENQHFDFIFILDSDVFFNKINFPSILAIMNNLVSGDIITFDAAKIREEDVDDILCGKNIDLNGIDWDYAYSGSKCLGPLADGRLGGLGGAFIADIDLILGNGGYNEKYTGWGGEDGELLDRIMHSYMKHEIKPIRDFAPFHLPHLVEWNNPKYSVRFN